MSSYCDSCQNIICHNYIDHDNFELLCENYDTEYITVEGYLLCSKCVVNCKFCNKYSIDHICEICDKKILEIKNHKNDITDKLPLEIINYIS